jgi:hypothetical protein
MNWKLWIKGLVSALSGGLSVGVTTVVVAPDTFNFQTGWKKILIVAGVSAIVAVLNYIKQSPLPE